MTERTGYTSLGLVVCAQQQHEVVAKAFLIRSYIVQPVPFSSSSDLVYALVIRHGTWEESEVVSYKATNARNTLLCTIYYTKDIK